jgi:hypothetical protein
MKRNLGVGVIILAVFLVTGCKEKYSPDQYLSTAEKDTITDTFLPYILPRPDKLSLPDRFKDSMKIYYRLQIAPQELKLYKYHIDKDSLHYVMFIRKDLKSLYIDYRAIAATFNRNKDSIYNIELKFLTPMFRRDTIYHKADELFTLLVETGSVQKYVGNRDFIDWPSSDVYYDKKERKWALIKNSDWDKLKEEAKKE